MPGKRKKPKSLCTDSHLLSASTWDVRLRGFSLLFTRIHHWRLWRQPKWMLSYHIQKYLLLKVRLKHTRTRTHTCAHTHHLIMLFFQVKQSFPRGPQKHPVCAKAEAQPEQSGLLSRPPGSHRPGARGAGGRVGIIPITMINTAVGCWETPGRKRGNSSFWSTRFKNMLVLDEALSQRSQGPVSSKGNH